MKKLVIAVFAAMVGLSMMVPEAEAKRFGGGRSAGMQRQATPAPSAPSQAGKPAAAPAAPAAAGKPAGMSRFLGPWPDSRPVWASLPCCRISAWAREWPTCC